MKNSFKSLLITGTLLASLVSPISSFAAGNDNGSYGQPCNGAYGSNTCSTDIVVIKTVQNPITHNYVDNLASSGDKFNPGQEIKFQIKVFNNGNTKLENIEVKDTLPSYIEFVSGFGKFDPNTKVLTLNISKLEANETKKLDITAKIADANKLPGDQAVVCAVNHVSAQSGGDMSEDNTQFCIQKNVLQVLSAPKIAETPSTGPEMLSLFALLPAGLAGLTLRKKS